MRFATVVVFALASLAVAALTTGTAGTAAKADPDARAASDDPSQGRPGPRRSSTRRATDVGPDGLPVAALAAAVAGETEDLRLGMVRPESFRPDEVAVSDQAGVVIADLLYDGLTEVDGSSGTLRPGLAIDWRPDREFRRWTFRLDPAAGTTAAVVVESLQPLAIGSGERPGGERSRSAAALTAAMTSIEVGDDDTVVIELERSNAGLPWVLSGLAYSVVGPDDAPTGGYRIERDDVAGLHLVRRTEGRSGEAGPADVAVRWAEDPAAAYRMLNDGEVAAAIADEASLADARRRHGWTPKPSSAVRFWVLNSTAGPLVDLDRRSDLLRGIDQAALAAGPGRGDRHHIDGLVSPSLAGWEPTPDPAGVAGRDDRETAAVDRGLPAADWPVLRVASVGRERSGLNDALVDQLQAAGFEAVGGTVDPGGLAADIVDGSVDLFAFGWLAPAGSVDAVLPVLLGRDSAANVARIADPRVQALLDRAAVIADDRARWALLREAHEVALTEQKVLPLMALTGTMVVASEWPGLVIRADGSLDLESSAPTPVRRP